MAFVLVHGAGFTSQCWEAVVPHLAGEVLAVDLPGRGRRPADLREVSQTGFAEAVVADIEQADLRDVVLVGHSMGGLTLPRVAALIPERIRRLVFVACVVPAHGRTLLGAVDDDFDAEVAERSAAHLSPEQAEMVLPPEVATVSFCNDMDLTQTARTLALLVPESIAVMTEPVDMSGLRQPIPRSWVRLAQDAVVTPPTQDAFIEYVGADEVVHLDAGHMAMISRPKELGQVLNRYA